MVCVTTYSLVGEYVLDMHHIFSQQAGPLCSGESSKMQLCGHRKKAEKADWDGVCSGVWCVRNKTSYIS